MWLTLLAIGVGVLCAFAVCVSIFGGIHVAVLLFGVSLNGIAIDYCLQYVTARFGADAGTPHDRLRHVLPGITLGAATTLIGYATLMLAPFPGLHQLAVFSAVGLLGSFITIVLWLPFLDSPEPLARGAHILAMANLALGVLGRRALSALAMERYCVDWNYDDSWRDQAAESMTISGISRRSPAICATQESQIRRLTGISGGTEFLLVRAANEDSALQTEEALRRAAYVRSARWCDSWVSIARAVRPFRRASA